MRKGSTIGGVSSRGALSRDFATNAASACSLAKSRHSHHVSACGFTKMRKSVAPTLGSGGASGRGKPSGSSPKKFFDKVEDLRSKSGSMIGCGLYKKRPSAQIVAT